MSLMLKRLLRKSFFLWLQEKLYFSRITIMNNNYESSFGDLYIVPIHGYDEAKEAKERAEDARFGDDYDEEMYRGLRPEIIRTLLDKVGETAFSPVMASILFRAGVEMPLVSRHALYNDYLMQPHSLPKLFGVYLDADRIQVDAAPDGLLLAQGFNRKAYRGYEIVTTDFWRNPDSTDIASVEREARDMAQRAILSDYYLSNYLFVEQDTVIHEIMGDEEKTIAELKIAPEDYTEGYSRPRPVDRMGRLEDIHTYTGKPELLESFRDLYKALNAEVDSKGGEGEDLYELRLNESEITALNKLQKLTGTDQMTGLLIDREDRENHGEYWYRGDDDPNPFYTNGWGDMTVRLELEFGGMVKCYTLSVYMDSGRKEAYLAKYTAELHQTSSWVAKEAGHMLASMQDPLAEDTGFNEIDEFEYQDLLRLVRNIQAVTTLS